MGTRASPSWWLGTLARREIVQSRGRWRAILPRPLATWLAKRALENQPALGIANAFWGCGNPRLLRSFAHRLSYLHDSAAAQQIAGAWREPGGPLSDLGDRQAARAIDQALQREIAAEAEREVNRDERFE